MRFEYSVDGQRYLGTLYPSPAAGPVAAIVLLPDWRGQGALARSHADYLTDLGCTVVVADLYGDGFNPDRPEQVGPMVKRLLEDRDDGVKALAACVTRLREEVAPGTPVICLGYSAGGMIALDYARSGADTAGVVLCSALLKTAAPGSDTHIAAPVLILQGTQDQVSPMETIDAVIADDGRRRQRRALRTLQPDAPRFRQPGRRHRPHRTAGLFGEIGAPRQAGDRAFHRGSRREDEG